MGYNYETQKPNLFTDQGQRMFLKVRDKANWLLGQSGAVQSEKLLVAGDSWDALACIDRMIELGELLEIPNTISRAGQHRILIKPYNG